MKRIKITRHTVIVVICLLLVFGAGILSNKLWNSQVAHDRIVSAGKAAAAIEKQHAQERHNAQVKAQFAAECNKEVAYYNSLTPVQKKDKAAPACSTLEVVQ